MPPSARSPRPLLLKQLIAVVDKRTTMVCLDAAGQIVGVDEPFRTLAGRYDHPPFHVHCRSTMAPWAQGMVDEMRRRANEEIERRPAKEKRKGPDGYEGPIPPPPPDVPDPDLPDPPGPETLPLSPGQLAEADLLDGDGSTWADSDALETLRQEYERATDARYTTFAGERGKQRLEKGDDEYTALRDYVSESFEEVNDALRSGDRKRLPDRRQAIVRGLDSLAARTRTLRDLVLFRGMGSTMGDLRVGDVVQDDGYGSFSLSQFVALTYTAKNAKMLELSVPEGSQIVYADNVEELELVVPRGYRWRVVEVTGDRVKAVLER